MIDILMTSGGEQNVNNNVNHTVVRLILYPDILIEAIERAKLIKTAIVAADTYIFPIAKNT